MAQFFLMRQFFDRKKYIIIDVYSTITKKFVEENIDKHHLKPRVLAILLETIVKEDFDALLRRDKYNGRSSDKIHHMSDHK